MQMHSREWMETNMKEIERELQSNPALFSLFKTAVTCNETEINSAIEELNILKERRRFNA